MVMTAASSLISELRGSLIEESARIARDFAAIGDGRAAVAQRTRLVEDILKRLWQDLVSADLTDPRDFTLVATGGFGRGWLFPFSDIDLLFLHADRRGEEAHKEQIRRFSQELWDLKLKLSPASRTLAECDRFDPNNTEFTISLLDCRYLTGDRGLFARLRDKVIPKLVMREAKPLLQGLAEVTRERHGKFGQTVFHLEPNLKETPGGLRDYNVACWLALISAMGKLGDWPHASSLRAPVRKQLDAALEFLMATRCFLHFRHGRDEDWGCGCGGTYRCGLDADLLRACPCGAAHGNAVARGDSGSVVFAATAIPGLAFAAGKSRFFRGGWTDFSAAVVFAAGS
jgi:[protein-PII] uridylyltransferase